MSVSGKRVVQLLLGVIFLAAITAPLFPSHDAYAAQITSRKLTLSSSNPAASNATTTYTFVFTVPTTGTVVKSVSVDICTTAAGTCTMPTGFSNSSATLSSQPTGLGAASGWTVNDATSGSLRLLDAANATNPSGSQTVVFGNVQNPTTTNQSFYGRITTYSDSAWTTAIDTGTTAASTATQITLTGTMPESLIFCTGATISTTGGVPDCTTATSGSINFNQLFSPTDTAWATSQMAASTNAGSGYAITVNGATLTNGSNTIPVIGSTATASIHGVGQFGLNLVADTTPNITTSANVAPSANGTNYRGQPASSPTNFGTTNQYAFTAASLNTVAASDNGGAGPTDAQIFTASYVVNVSGSQAAGTYTTTLTYICTPTF